jgi:hypothetical protein
MSQIEYISLYDYLGRSVRNSDDGYKVAEMAIQKGIKPKYKKLPEEVQTDKYKSVATYPIDFLDSIYKRPEQNLVRKDELYAVLRKVKELEEKLNNILNATNSNVNDADDLPF